MCYIVQNDLPIICLSESKIEHMKLTFQGRNCVFDKHIEEWQCSDWIEQ